MYATNTGANIQTRGYAKRSINYLPDSTVTSTNWLNPGNSQSASFTQTKGHVYYGQITVFPSSLPRHARLQNSGVVILQGTPFEEHEAHSDCKLSFSDSLPSSVTGMPPHVHMWIGFVMVNDRIQRVLFPVAFTNKVK